MTFQNPGATATMIVQDSDRILLIKRKNPPYQGMWALPGGFLEYGKETLEETACRELEEETGLKARVEDLALLRVSSSPDRDPRGHVIDHVYVVRKYTGKARASDDASSLEWFALQNIPKIAFDHNEAVRDYINRGGKNGN